MCNRFFYRLIINSLSFCLCLCLFLLSCLDSSDTVLTQHEKDQNKYYGETEPYPDAQVAFIAYIRRGRIALYCVNVTESLNVVKLVNIINLVIGHIEGGCAQAVTVRGCDYVGVVEQRQIHTIVGYDIRCDQPRFLKCRTS